MFISLKTINRFLDRLVRLEPRALEKGRSGFRTFAFAGLGLAVTLALALKAPLGLSVWVLLILVLSSVSTYFALSVVTGRIMGEARLIYYHHVIAVTVVAAGVLWLMDQPILPYLDVTILGLGTILAFGRLGCLIGSCCHGRPSRLGVCYTEEHAASGIPPYLVGVRLFPVQGLESLLAFCIVPIGVVLALTSHRAGEALSWFVVTYASGRFAFEFVRGDAPRPYFFEFSEAQLTSLILACLITVGEAQGVLPFHLWHMVVTGCLVITMIATTLVRRLRRTARHLLLHPRHVSEVAQALEWVANLATTKAAFSEDDSAPSNIKVGTTSLGIQISASTIEQGGRSIYHYALSSRAGTISEETVKTLARLILQLKHPSGATELARGNRGVFHLLVHPRSKQLT